MWVAQFLQVIPVFLIKASEWGEDEDAFAVDNRVACAGEIVEIVVYDWWRSLISITAVGLGFQEWFCGWGERVFGGILLALTR